MITTNLLGRCLLLLIALTQGLSVEQQCISQSSFTFSSLHTPAPTSSPASILITGSISPICTLQDALAPSDNQAILNGYQLLVDYANSLGMLQIDGNSYGVDVQVIQDECNVTLTSLAYNELKNQSMGLYVSPFSLTSTQAAYEITTTAQSNSLMISPSVDVSSLYGDGSSTTRLYGILPNPSQYIPTAFEFIKYLNV